ncbi:MAG: dihydropteroate synthase [Bacillota bacterium]
MFVISGSINTSLPGISEIVKLRDAKALVAIAGQQVELGAHMIAPNCGTHLESEAEDMEWMVQTLQDNVDVRLGIDSPSAEVQAAGLALIKRGRPLVDSITLEKSRIDGIMPLVKRYNAQLIALLHDEKGMPKTVEDRLRVMPKLDKVVEEYGVDKKDVLLDPLVFPLSVDSENCNIFLETVRRLRCEYPEYSISCGLDNMSYGLPEPELLNVMMLGMIAGAGQDYVMIKMTPAVSAYLKALQALTAVDEYCIEYIEAYREGALKF